MKQLIFAWFLLTATAAAARAAPPDPAAPAQDDLDTFAIVVGSNPGGAGQTELRFAEDDARRVADVLGDLGGYDKQHIALVLHPSPDAVMSAIDRVSAAVAADQAAGRRTMVFFYYSGHAKASALDLGADELSLASLREKIMAVPATLTVVVLDACQSGAFSRVKGAEPAADFSFNSRTKLDATGIVVMASSSASELSQESDLLQSSYFTHHLLVGLRGAGDVNGDGRVSLDEAYQYAYHQTLIATAQTAVGEQHVSLEVDLKGQGEVALTYPAKATARIALQGDLAGEIVVEKLPAQAVIAEIAKSRGAPVRIAVAPGQYRVLVHHDHVVDRCAVAVSEGEDAQLGTCDTMPEVAATTAKGPGDVPPWSVDLSFGIGPGIKDAFTKRLGDFGYTQQLGVPGELAITALTRVHPYVATGVEVGELFAPEWQRGTDLMPLRYTFHATTVAGVMRAERRVLRHVQLYGQAGLGLAIGGDTLTDETGTTSSKTYWSYVVSATGGAIWAPFDRLGFTLRASYVRAPAVNDLIGDTHDTGGLFVGFGLEYRP